MGYINPLLELPAGRRLQELPPEQRAAIADVMRDLRHQANDKAEESWSKRKGPMAAYWRAVSTYARHLAHALTRATDNAGISCRHKQPETTGDAEDER